MPMSRVLSTHTRNQRLIPYWPCDAKRDHMNIAPGITIQAGTVLGKYSASANAVHTVTVTGTPTGGTFTLTGTDPITGGAFTTAAIAYNAAASAVASAVQTAMGNGITVTGGGGALPGTPVTLTYTGNAAGRPVPVLALGTNGLTGGTTPTASVASTTAGRTAGTAGVYNNGGSGGLETAVAIMEYTVTTRSDGTVVVGENVVSPDSGEGLISVPVYLNGAFLATDLTGWDTNAAADLAARTVNGVVIIPGAS